MPSRKKTLPMKYSSLELSDTNTCQKLLQMIYKWQKECFLLQISRYFDNKKLNLLIIINTQFQFTRNSRIKHCKKFRKYNKIQYSILTPKYSEWLSFKTITKILTNFTKLTFHLSFPPHSQLKTVPLWEHYYIYQCHFCPIKQMKKGWNLWHQ